MKIYMWIIIGLVLVAGGGGLYWSDKKGKLGALSKAFDNAHKTDLPTDQTSGGNLGANNIGGELPPNFMPDNLMPDQYMVNMGMGTTTPVNNNNGTTTINGQTGVTAVVLPSGNVVTGGLQGTPHIVAQVPPSTVPKNTAAILTPTGGVVVHVSALNNSVPVSGGIAKAITPTTSGNVVVATHTIAPAAIHTAIAGTNATAPSAAGAPTVSKTTTTTTTTTVAPHTNASAPGSAGTVITPVPPKITLPGANVGGGAKKITAGAMV